MGVPVLIIGESGSGKSYSIKGLPTADTGIFSVEKGRLPFKADFKIKTRASYRDINSIFKDPKMKRYVIDDSQFLMVNAMFDRAKETGYGKYTDFALDFRNLVHNVNYLLPDDVIVYFLHHTETDPNTGKVKAKTVGKMIDQYLTLEGCFDIVLLAETDGKEHYFVTQSDGNTTAKSPFGMFPAKIDNDLAAVDKAIREYWSL